MSRRSARETAMRLLFAWELSGEGGIEPVYETMDIADLNDADRDYILSVTQGIIGDIADLDQRVLQQTKGWKLERLAKVDLAILRLAFYEILYREDVPRSAAINEAVELAKTYGSERSGRFVNGILGGFSRALEAEQ